MSGSTRFSWWRIAVAVLAAEALPILLLVLIVVLYSVVRSVDSPSPEEFAPRAGNWVGPIGGFLATCLFAWWAARRAPQRPIAHGAAVGLGTALLDFGLGLLLGGGGAIDPVFYLSNGGRIVAGLLGGWIAARRRDLATGQPAEPSP
jgi:hypothetical protein